MNVKTKQHYRFNYAFVVRTLLALLCGPLRYHVNLINAAAGCKTFSKDDYRYIRLSDSNYRRYLTNMKNEERNATEEIRIIFSSGFYDESNNVYYEKPNADLFSEITSGLWHFKHEKAALDFRNTITEVLINGDNSHMTDMEIDNLLDLAQDVNITFPVFVFNCINTAVMCGGNTRNRKIYKSKLDETEREIIHYVKGLSKAETENLRSK